jgi:hypothetical protein
MSWSADSTATDRPGRSDRGPGVPAVALAAPAHAAASSGGATTLSAVKVGTHHQSGHPKLVVTQRIQVEMHTHGGHQG